MIFVLSVKSTVNCINQVVFKIKIAFLIGSLRQGGAERQIYETSKLLAKDENNKVSILFYEENNHYEFSKNNINLIKLESKGKSDRLFSLYKTVKQNEFDFVISFLEKTNLYLGIVGKFLYKRRRTIFIGSERNTRLIYSNSKKWQFISSIAYKGLDALIVNSNKAKKHISKTINYPNEKILLLRNLLNTDKFKPSDLLEHDLTLFSNLIDKDKNLFLVPARLHPQKNQHILIDTMKMLLHKDVNNIQFILAGDSKSTYAEKIKKNIEEEQLQKQFVFLDKVKNMENLYNLVDFVLLPSLYEGFPNAILEGMACGKICLSTDTSDIKEIIQDKKNGFIIVENNATSISKTITEVIKLSNAHKKEIEKKAFESVQKYGKENYTTNFYSILKHISQID